MAKTEKLLERLEALRQETGVARTIFAVCPNSMSVIRASFRAAKRNHAPIYFAATLNQIDGDGGYTGMVQSQFTKMLQFEKASDLICELPVMEGAVFDHWIETSDYSYEAAYCRWWRLPD